MTVTLEPDCLGLKSWSHLLPDRGPGASYEISLCFHLFVSYCEDQHSKQYLAHSEHFISVNYCYVCYSRPNAEDQYVS